MNEHDANLFTSDTSSGSTRKPRVRVKQQRLRPGWRVRISGPCEIVSMGGETRIAIHATEIVEISRALPPRT